MVSLRTQSSLRVSARRALIVRSVAGGTPVPVAGKRLGIALGVAATGVAGLAVATLAVDQSVDVLQTLGHIPQDVWGLYQAELLSHPLQTKVRGNYSARCSLML